MTTPWLIVLIMLVLSAFFSGLETAFLTANKLRIQLQSKRNVFPAPILSYFIKNSSHYISTMLVGNCISLVVFSIFMEEILEPHLKTYIDSKLIILLLTTVLSTIFILVTAEFLPKNLFRINSNRMLMVFAIPLLLVYMLLYPVVFITNKIARFILRFALGTKFPEKELSFGRMDLVHYIHENTSSVLKRHELENEVKIFKRALGFSKVKARDCMIPRTEIAAINIDESVEVLDRKSTRLNSSH